MAPYRLPDRAQRLLAAELAAGESVQWVGQPAPPAFSLPIGSVLMGLFMAGFGIFWMQGAMQGGFVFALGGLVPVCAGVALALSPFLLWGRLRDAAENTAYVITDRRAIVIGGYRPEHVLLMKMGMPFFLAGPVLDGAGSAGLTAYHPDTFEEIQRHQHADGTGDVVFKKEFLGRAVHPIGFFSVQDASTAEALLRALANGDRTAAESSPRALANRDRTDGITPSVRHPAPVAVSPVQARPAGGTRGLGMGLLGGAIVLVVALAVVYFVLIRPVLFTDVTGPGPFTAKSGELTLTVTKVETSPARFRVWMTATNGTDDSLSLPIFGYFFVQDNAGRQYKADPFSSTFRGDVAPGGLILGYAEIHEPLAPGARRLKVGFSHVFGSFDVNSITVTDVVLR